MKIRPAVFAGAPTAHRFAVRTWADTGSNRRDRTYVVEAATSAEAKAQATELALRDIRHWVTILCTISDVDGNGPPTNCPHYNFIDGWVTRADGGRECFTCAVA